MCFSFNNPPSPHHRQRVKRFSFITLVLPQKHAKKFRDISIWGQCVLPLCRSLCESLLIQAQWQTLLRFFLYTSQRILNSLCGLVIITLRADMRAGRVRAGPPLIIFGFCSLATALFGWGLLYTKWITLSTLCVNEALCSFFKFLQMVKMWISKKVL